MLSIRSIIVVLHFRRAARVAAVSLGEGSGAT
jgi:hypothetical protein